MDIDNASANHDASELGVKVVYHKAKSSDDELVPENKRLGHAIAENRQLRFTLMGVHESIANAIRRILLSEIPVVAICGFPHSECDIDIIENNSQVRQNEILKQRISCVPIHLLPNDPNIDHYLTNIQLVIDEKHTDVSTRDYDRVKEITTKDFKLIDLSSPETVLDATKLLPPCTNLEDDNLFILLTKLAPGGNISLKCKLSIQYASGKGGAYNAVCKASCFCTQDMDRIPHEQTKFETELKKQVTNEDERKREIANWLILDAKRFTVPNSFEFIVESVHSYASVPNGGYTNRTLVDTACDIIIRKLYELLYSNGGIDSMPEFVLEQIRRGGQPTIVSSSIVSGTTFSKLAQKMVKMPDADVANNISGNKLHIMIHGEGDTLGRMIEHQMYQNYGPESKTVGDDKRLNMCVYNKRHPFDESFVIDVEPAMISGVDDAENTIRNYLNVCIEELIDIYKSIKRQLVVSYD